MSERLFQYQGRVSPSPAVLGESAVTLDQWEPRWSLPCWLTRPRPAGWWSSPDAAVLSEPVATLDQWEPRWSLPRWSALFRSQGMFVSPDSSVLAQSAVAIDQWYQDQGSPRRNPRPVAEGFTVVPPGLPGYVVPGEWDRPQSLPTPSAKRNPHGGVVSAPDLADLPAAFDWVREPVVPVRTLLNPGGGISAPVTVSEPEVAPSMDWLREAVLPAWRVLPRPAGGVSAVPNLADQVVPSDWLREAVLPAWGDLPCPAGGFTAPVTVSEPEVAPSMDWLREAVLPAWHVPPRSVGGAVGSSEPSLYVVPPLDWLVPCAPWQRVPLVLPCGVEGVYVGEPIAPPPAPSETASPGGVFRRSAAWAVRLFLRAGPLRLWRRTPRVTTRLWRARGMSNAKLPADTLYKTTEEAKTFAFDFSKEGAVVAGETLTVIEVEGSPSGLTIGTPAVTTATFDGIASGKAIKVRISGGTAGTTYELACRATTSGGDTLEIPGVLIVTETV